MKLLCPSMMCANYDCLKEEVLLLDKAGADIFHCDVMDGQFVNNIAMGLHDIQSICKNTNKIVDVHLMMYDPIRYIDMLHEAGVNLIYIHYECDKHIARTLQYIKILGMKSGLVISPNISITCIEDLLTISDYVLVMSVNPGFAGQSYLDFVDKKIEKLLKLKNDFDFKIIIDGSCSTEVIKRLSLIGVDGFILGTSALFNKGESYETIFKELRDICM